MTRGRSKDRTYTGYNGAREETLRAKDKLAHTPAGISGQVAPPGRFREFIEAGQCPFCGESFRNVAQHTNRAHGIGASELKEMAGIPKTKPACSVEFSEALSEMRKGAYGPEYMAKLRDARKGGRRSFSEAGKAAQRAKLAKVDRAKAGAAITRRRYAATAERDRAIVARLNAGESSESIQQDLGISGSTVRRALVRLGDGRDLRSDAGKRRGISNEARRGQQRAAVTRRAERLAAFHLLGGDWPALCQLAEDLGIGRAALRDYLVRRCGVQIDGRTWDEYPEARP